MVLLLLAMYLSVCELCDGHSLLSLADRVGHSGQVSETAKILCVAKAQRRATDLASLLFFPSEKYNIVVVRFAI